jgi:hypothetical protein
MTMAGMTDTIILITIVAAIKIAPKTIAAIPNPLAVLAEL